MEVFLAVVAMAGIVVFVAGVVWGLIRWLDDAKEVLHPDAFEYSDDVRFIVPPSLTEEEREHYYSRLKKAAEHGREDAMGTMLILDKLS